jgi:hypothetical protein
VTDRPDVDQLYRALVALRAEPTPDPQTRPDGPIEADRPMLLALLWGLVESNLAGLDQNDADRAADVWLTRLGADQVRWEPILAERARLTAHQLGRLEGSAVIDAAATLATAAANLLLVATALELPGMTDSPADSVNRTEVAALVEIVRGRLIAVPAAFRRVVDALRHAGHLDPPA